MNNSFGRFILPINPIFADKTEINQDHDQSTTNMSDEEMYGNYCRIIESDEQWSEIITHYGYHGYVRSCCLEKLDDEEYILSNKQHKMLTFQHKTDVLSVASVRGVLLISLPAGSVLDISEINEETGWTSVKLCDGRIGYVRGHSLIPKLYNEGYLKESPQYVVDLLKEKDRFSIGGNKNFNFQEILDTNYDGDENAFRQKLIDNSKFYLGLQYRWGGRSTDGIDCSGLVNMAYLLSGIQIFRDSRICNGFPLKRLSPEHYDGKMLCDDIRLGKIRVGDTIYFPGHVAIYMGEWRYIHSTAYKLSCGVVINSLNSEDPDFREDLFDIIYAVGGIR